MMLVQKLSLVGFAVHDGTYILHCTYVGLSCTPLQYIPIQQLICVANNMSLC